MFPVQVRLIEAKPSVRHSISHCRFWFAITSISTLLLAAGASTCMGQTSLHISNNSFELPASAGQQIYINGSGATSTFVTGWITATTAGYWDLQYTNNTSGVTNEDGLQLLEVYDVGGGLAGVVYQELTNKWVVGATYTLTARAGQATNSANTPNTGDTFSIDAKNGGTLTQLGSTTISNAKAGLLNYAVTYTATGSEPGDGYVVVAFHVPSQGSTGGMWIDDFAITCTAPDPAVTAPTSQTVLPGQTATFSVTALGATPFSYQWQATNAASGGFTNLANGGQFSGVNTNVLTISNASTNSVRYYRVIATDTAGSVTSSVASLILLPNTILMNVDFGSGATQSGAAVLGAAGDAWNTVTASTGTLVNSANSTFSGIGLTLASSGTYTDTGGTAIDAATSPLMQDYTYGYGTAVTASITGLAPYVNSAFTLVVYASGNAAGQGGSLTLTGATGGNAWSTLTTTAATRQISSGIGVAYNTFTGIITNGTLTLTSVVLTGQSYTAVNGFQLLLNPRPDPAIYFAPQSQTVAPGGNATFSVTPVGTTPFSYQWQVNTGTGFTNLLNGGQISGATNATLTVANVLPWANPSWVASFQVIVTNSIGAVTSAPASLICNYVAPGGNVQAAINQAYNNGGGQVNLGPGTYYGNIVMYGGITLNGAGSDTIIAASTISGVQTDPASSYTVQNLVVDGQISCSFFSIGAANVPGIKSVSGLSGLPGINGGNSGGSPASYNLTYRNVEVKNTSIGMQCWSVYGLVITNCNFHDDGIGFSHNIYLVGCPGFQIVNSISSWSRTGDALHLDFASDGGYTNSFTQCEFDGAWGIGILDQAYNGSANYTKMKGCGIKYGGQSGGDGTGMDIDYTGDLQTTRFEDNHGNGATIRGSTALLYDSFNGNSSAPYFTYAAASNNLVGGSGPNIYHAALADGVTGPNNTADWVTGYGGQTEGSVDFNANHSLNGELTWPNVSSTSAGIKQLSLVYANGASTNVAMNMIVNSGFTNTLKFPPTGSWSTYSAISSNVTLTAANNTVQMLVSFPGATCPVLSALVVNDAVPSVPTAPSGLAYVALTNAPKYDLSCWIRLSWNAVSGATYYNIQRNGLWIATGVPTNGFTDYHVPFTGTAFTYNIVPVNAGGAGSGAAITAYSLTGFPVVLTAVTNGPGSVTLTSSWSTNAATYNAYRSPVSGGPYSFIGSTGLTTNITSSSTNYFGIFTDTNAPAGINYYVMTAYNGVTESLYSPEAAVVVTGRASAVGTNAYLTSLTLNPPGSLSPAFASNTFGYLATNLYSSLPTVTVTNADPTATNRLIYQGTTNLLASGMASGPLTLTLGLTNLVQVQVTAQDGVTMQIYTVNVSELPNQTPQPSLTNSWNQGALNLSWGPDRVGYRLLQQTNNLNQGVSTNPNDWATVPGSAATNQLSFPISLTNLNEFYRLVYP